MGFAPEDIEQGQLGDCWLISAMSLLALRDAEGRGGLENVFVTRDTAPTGATSAGSTRRRLGAGGGRRLTTGCPRAARRPAPANLRVFKGQ